MQKHELRNEQPPLGEREIELLIYGVFSGFEGDKGYYFTAWVPLGDVLMNISRETVICKLATFRDGLAQALEAACAIPAATVPQDSSASGPAASAAAAVPAPAISPVPIGSGLTPPGEQQ